MSDLLPLRALLFVGECFAASALLPLPVFAVTAMVRRAALRHLVWATLSGVLAVLPFVALVLPPRRIVEHGTVPVAAAPVVAAPVTPSLFTLENLVLAFAAIWLGGLIWQMLRLCTGGLGLMHLRRASVSFAAPLACDVRLAADESGPSTFGILRPVVLLPRSAAGWAPARLDAVLRHEGAHVARRDTLSQFIARLACALYWPNPLVWLAARQLRREAEIAADDAVLASGMTPSAYAAELVALAAESRGAASSIPLGIAMARPPLTARVEAVLADNVSRKGVNRMDIAKTICCGLAATLLLGAARFDLAVAQGAPVAQTGVAAAPRGETEQQAGAEARDHAAADKAKAQAAAARSYAEERQKGAEARDRAAVDKAKAQADAARSYAEERQNAAEAMQRAAADHARAGEARRAAEQARREMAQIQPEIDRAMANAHIEEQVAKALADARIQEAVVKAMADAHVDAVTAKAVADAHIEEKIAAAMASVRPVIQAAIARAVALVAPIPPAPVPPPPYAPN